MSINQAYKSIYKESIKKQLQAHHLSNSVISNNITANTAATSTTSPTANLTSHVLEIKEGDRLIRSTEKSSEGDDIIKQNCELKQEIQNLREQIKSLEQMNRQQYQQQEEEWSDTKIIDIFDRSVPIKVTVNNSKREIVFMEIDIDYIKRKKKENREMQLQKQQRKTTKEI